MATFVNQYKVSDKIEYYKNVFECLIAEDCSIEKAIMYVGQLIVKDSNNHVLMSVMESHYESRH
jgi:hypothetical protein